MLSRVSSDAGTRLRRSKSTSTVHTYRTVTSEHLDSDVARKHAIAAATTAFVKAHASGEEGKTKKRSSEVSRKKSNASRKSLGHPGSHFPPRESSFRSNQILKTAKGPSVSCQMHAPSTVTEQFPPFYCTPDTDKTMSSQLSVASNGNTRPTSQPKPNRLSASSSAASQQIRKARSMYYASSIQTGSPIARPPAKYLTTPPSISSAPCNRLPSTRGAESHVQCPRNAAVSPLASTRLPVAVAPNDDVNKARDRYLQAFQEPRRVKHKPSLFLAPFKKRQDKGKGKDLSFSHGEDLYKGNHTPTDTTLDVTLSDFRPPKEKRSISDSLRSKFKKVFRRSSNKTIFIPVQQIEASRDYFSEQTKTLDPPPLSYSQFEVPSPDEDTLQRVRSRSPSLESRRPAFARPSSRGSHRSLHSEASISNATTSRVTSWGDSSAGNTLTQRDIKRLTVIHEAKDSVGSEAEHNRLPSPPKRKPPPISAFAAFREPMPVDSLMESVSTPVDPKRVFSALMREIDASKNGQPAAVQQTLDRENDVFASSATRELHSSASKHPRHSASRDFRPSVGSDSQRPLSCRYPDSVAAQTRTESIKSNSIKSLGQAFRSTIRAVTPTQHSSPPIPGHTTSVPRSVQIPRDDNEGSSADMTPEVSRSKYGHTSVDSIDLTIASRGDAPWRSQTGNIVSPTVDQMQSRIDKTHNRWKAALQENNVPRLHCPMKDSSTGATIASKAFFRTSLEEKVEETTSTDSFEVEKRAVTVISASPNSPKPRPLFSPLSPSVYSRNTDGISILPNDSVMSLDSAAGDGAEGRGEAVVITSCAVKSYSIAPSPEHAVESTRSSRDWKAWLSHEVSELEKLPNQEITISSEYTTPRGHRRELTRISDIDPKVISYKGDGSPMPEETPKAEIPAALQHSREISELSEKEHNTQTPSKPTREFQTPRTASQTPNPDPNPMLKQRRVSSILSDHSTASRPKLQTQSSERYMNERFPFIDTRRCSSVTSTRLSRHTPSIPGSGSSSLKATPSPKVYSDFSAPPPNKTVKNDSMAGSRKSEVLDNEHESKKENSTPTNVKAHGAFGFDATQPPGRPKSYQPLAALSANRASSSLAQYTTSIGDVKTVNTSSVTAVMPARVRVRIRPISPVKLTTRPKSAFDLRSTNKRAETPPHPPISTKLHASHRPIKENYQPSPDVAQKSITEPAVEGDTLRMLLEDSPWAASGTPSQRCSPQKNTLKPKARVLHVKHSSSTLALNKEPALGLEERNIASVLGESGREEYLGSRVGSATPGQRMADRFLRERTAGSGAGSPISMFSATDESSETVSPAFV